MMNHSGIRRVMASFALSAVVSVAMLGAWTSAPASAAAARTHNHARYSGHSNRAAGTHHCTHMSRTGK